MRSTKEGDELLRGVSVHEVFTRSVHAVYAKANQWFVFPTKTRRINNEEIILPEGG